MTISTEEESSTKNIRVVVRLRPQLGPECSQPDKLLKVTDDSCLMLHSPGQRVNLVKNFCFDGVLREHTSQVDVYNDAGIDEMVDAVVSGYHATVFAYGHTGSGKTYTMEGFKYKCSGLVGKPQAELCSVMDEQLGIIPRVVHRLFQITKRDPTSCCRFTIRCSHIQVYNEQAYDLLNPTSFGGTSSKEAHGKKLGAGLRMRWCKQKEFYLENNFSYECSTADEVLKHFKEGIKNKVMASHKMNLASSRSHCLFTIEVESSQITMPEEVIVSKFTLVDLAGSEKASTAQTMKGEMKKESIFINKSLFTLRKVISTLADTSMGPKSHVPYRDSKLTCLLKGSIGGSSLTLMIACIARGDAHYDENLSTLEYASQARRVMNKVSINEDPKTRVIRELREEVAFLRSQLFNSQPEFPEVTSQAGLDTMSNPLQLALSFQEEPCSTSQDSLHTPMDNAVIETLAAKFAQSVALVKDLTSKQQKLVKQNSDFHSELQETRVKNDDLLIENADLRDRIALLESIMTFEVPTNHNVRGGQLTEHRMPTSGSTFPQPKSLRPEKMIEGSNGTGKILEKRASSTGKILSEVQEKIPNLYTVEKAALLEVHELRNEKEALQKRLQELEKAKNGRQLPRPSNRQPSKSPGKKGIGNSAGRGQKTCLSGHSLPKQSENRLVPSNLPIRISTTGSVLPTMAIVASRTYEKETVAEDPPERPSTTSDMGMPQMLQKWMAERKVRRSDLAGF